jgi:hypothetical protein
MINSYVFVVHEITSGLESLNLVDPAICRYRKPKQILWGLMNVVGSVVTLNC